LKPGKKLIFVQSQGQPDPTFFDDVFPRYDRFFKRIGFTETHLVRAYGVAAPDDAAKKPEFVEEAESIARKVFGNKEVDW
jgi:FMN-dependent NADH-azoreductase